MTIKVIPLTRGRIARIDEEDFARVCVHRWHLHTGASKMMYASSKIDGELTVLHRFILGLKKHDGTCVDHMNGDGLDNRRWNLRIVSYSVNVLNRFREPRLGASGIRGLRYIASKNKWRASIWCPPVEGLARRVCNVRLFDSQEKAIAWRNEMSTLRALGCMPTPKIWKF